MGTVQFPAGSKLCICMGKKVCTSVAGSPEAILLVLLRANSRKRTAHGQSCAHCTMLCLHGVPCTPDLHDDDAWPHGCHASDRAAELRSHGHRDAICQLQTRHVWLRPCACQPWDMTAHHHSIHCRTWRMCHLGSCIDHSQVCRGLSACSTGYKPTQGLPAYKPTAHTSTKISDFPQPQSQMH
jgi:hypothetical protein